MSRKKFGSDIRQVMKACFIGCHYKCHYKDVTTNVTTKKWHPSGDESKKEIIKEKPDICAGVKRSRDRRREGKKKGGKKESTKGSGRRTKQDEKTRKKGKFMRMWSDAPRSLELAFRPLKFELWLKLTSPNHNCKDPEHTQNVFSIYMYVCHWGHVFPLYYVYSGSFEK